MSGLQGRKPIAGRLGPDPARERAAPVRPFLDELLSSYRVAERRFDELFAGPGSPRPHWRRLLEELGGFSAEGIRERQLNAERQIKESGITYNVYADPQGIGRPWDLDVLPLMIAPEEWRVIEAGISQRAELFNRILADVYGEQSLLRQGLVPASLIFNQTGFLRPAHGIKPPGGMHLHVYAADLARSEDGSWWVMADRTQAPSGAGYALENRLIVSRTFPSLYRDMPVQRLAHFFATLRDSLMHFAPRGHGPTLTVLLTPGPYNETYFEHTLLARYLGFPLVEGGDLTVRDGMVWLKTIRGLQRVHTILRRQDDTYCDPLELRTDSALGVAGLTDCARRGTVLIANALGAGLLESPALLGFLPRICESLMGAPLRLPSIATWWCGEPAALQDALGQADRLVFKTADPACSFAPIFGQDLDRKALKRLQAALSAQPEQFVAQELVRISQAPVLGNLGNPRIDARGIGLRVFAVASPEGYRVMPGGLTRVASGADVRVISMQSGGGSKDTWVLARGPVDTDFTLLRDTVTPADLLRVRAAVPSRVAENLFWFGRYQERCDDAARLLRLILGSRLQESSDDEGQSATPLVALARASELIGDAGDTDDALLAWTTDGTHAGSLSALLRQLDRLGYTLRDRMSLDNLRTLHTLLKEPAPASPPSLAEALSRLDRIIAGLMTLSGFVLDGMTRDDGWQFLSIGRRLERLGYQCLALQTAFTNSLRTGLTWLLQISDSIVTYRARYMARPEWLPVLDLLVLDGANPRSVLFNAKGVSDYFQKLERQYGPFGAPGFADCVGALEQLGPGDLDPESPALRSGLRHLHDAALDMSDRLTQRFFNHSRAGAWSTMGL
jgi:uncharacterized circularly permuted ATP-grasp superfamily protein/uncharacterized alpha-E superfamily protein